MYRKKVQSYSLLLTATIASSCLHFPALAQSTGTTSDTGSLSTTNSGTPGSLSTGSTPGVNPGGPMGQGPRENQQDLRQQWMQNHPNFAQNHPKAAQYFQNHPVQGQKAIDRSAERQFAQQHPNFGENHPGLAKFDGKHPIWATDHPRLATGRGRRGR